jgi:hypothetical protein
MFILIPVGLIMLAAVIYLALSKKSNFTIRIAALIALGLMILSVIVSLFIIFFGVGAVKPEGPFLPFAEPPPEPPAVKGDIMVLVGFVLFLIALFVVVFVLSLREQRKNGKN